MRTVIMAHKVIWIVFFICLLLLLFPVGCTPVKESGLGFRLPEGSIERGKQAFVDLDCVRCHSIAGQVDSRGTELSREIHVVLGGDTTRVKNYGQLVTSVIYPSHIILPSMREKYLNSDGTSKMPDMTGDMSVRQMIDLVTYLQSTYQVKAPPSAYDMLYPGL